MMKRVEFEAKTLIEAQKLAVEQLRIPLDKIELIITREKRGILGIGATTFYEAKANVNLPLEGKAYLEDILKNLNIEVKMEMLTKKEGREIYYHLFSEENALLIGRGGTTLRSIQYLLRSYLNSFTKEFVIVNVDIGNYNENRKRQLEIIATKSAKEVVETNIPVTLDPMNGYERRIIHTKLSEWRDVTTESIGEGANRAIVIKPKK